MNPQGKPSKKINYNRNPKGRQSKNLDFNRNHFAVATDDVLAKQIRTFCKENKCNTNQFLKTVLKNYFNDELKTTIQSGG